MCAFWPSALGYWVVAHSAGQIKYLRVPDEIIDLVKDQQQSQPSSRGRGGGVQRGDRGGRGDRGHGARSGRGRGRGRGG